eukprot:scaffold295794_cov24-Tisochrysis_lutea.AAC.1
MEITKAAVHIGPGQPHALIFAEDLLALPYATTVPKAPDNLLALLCAITAPRLVRISTVAQWSTMVSLLSNKNQSKSFDLLLDLLHLDLIAWNCAGPSVSIFYTAPTAVRALHAKGDEWVTRHSRASLRLLGSVGEPINPDAHRWYKDVVGGG